MNSRNFSVTIVLIKTRSDPKEFKGLFSIKSPYQDPIPKNTRDCSVATSPRAYGKVRKPLLRKKTRITKKLQERKFTKTKPKEIVVPMPREDPKEPRKISFKT